MPGAGEFLGDWVVVRPLGEGGMGSVLLCHSQLSEEVQAAVKVLKAHGLGDFRRRFVDEMRTLASLSHPSIVSVLSGGQDADRNLVYMAMELIDGGDLEHRMRQGPLSRAEAEEVFLPIADALAYAHRHGVHHRDLKPANLMLRNDGPPVLVDFGIAVASDRTRLTTEGMVPGTAAYMPPEVFRGEDLDHGLADIYALGVVLYEALTGEHAFWIDGDMSDGQRLFQVVGLKVQSDALDPGPSIDEPLRDLVRSMTHPDPSRRLSDLGQVARAFGTVPSRTLWVEGSSAVRTVRDQPAPTVGQVEEEPVVDAVEPANVPVPRRRDRRTLWAIGGGLAALGMAAVAMAAVGIGAVAWTSLGGIEGPVSTVEEVTISPVDARVAEVASDPAAEAAEVDLALESEAGAPEALEDEDVLRPVRTAAVAAAPAPVRRAVRAPAPAPEAAAVAEVVVEAAKAEALDVVVEPVVEPVREPAPEPAAPRWASTVSEASSLGLSTDEGEDADEEDEGGRRRRSRSRGRSSSSGTSGGYGGSYGGGYGY